MRLENKRALITGGARGIGKAIAELFLLEGARVIVLDHRADILQATALELTELLGRHNLPSERIKSVRCDLAQPDEIAAASRWCTEQFDGLDILINNAGVAFREDFAEITADHWNLVMNTNARSMFLLSQAVAADMIKRGIPGSIVNMSSKNGLAASAKLAHYNASKGAVQLLTQTMAVELAGYRIRVNSVAPGFIETPLDRELKAQDPGLALTDRTPMGRMGTPKEVAHAFLFLASDDASYITGATLVVDGGHMANAGAL